MYNLALCICLHMFMYSSDLPICTHFPYTQPTHTHCFIRSSPPMTPACVSHTLSSKSTICSGAAPSSVASSSSSSAWCFSSGLSVPVAAPVLASPSLLGAAALPALIGLVLFSPSDPYASAGVMRMRRKTLCFDCSVFAW